MSIYQSIWAWAGPVLARRLYRMRLDTSFVLKYLVALLTKLKSQLQQCNSPYIFPRGHLRIQCSNSARQYVARGPPLSKLHRKYPNMSPCGVRP